jgi:hypothetical protein
VSAVADFFDKGTDSDGCEDDETAHFDVLLNFRVFLMRLLRIMFGGQKL